ncbi:MAG: hypothetical protein O7G85_14970, partial [Planctomycetota bacterium]|nr:hypothetical protein [Planctomycetota bacterium]
MTVLPEHFIDVQREDRFCTQCGENLRLACIVVEPHYGMHLIHCPKCAHPEQVELRPLARTAQRCTGLLLALWFLIMLWMWAMTNGAMMGMTIGILEDTNNDLATYIKQAYEQDHPEDAGGIMRTSAQQVSTNTPLPGTISPVGNNIIIPTPPTSPVDTSTDDNEDIVETEAEETVIDKDIDATSDDDLTPEEQELRDEMANINAAIQQAKQLTTGAMTPNQLTLPSGAPGGTVQVIQAGPGRQII